MSQVRIAYLAVDADLLPQVEAALIEWFQPPLNRPSGLQPREAMYNEPKKRRQLMATDEGWDGLKQGAKGIDLSASELVERVGRGFVESDSDLEILFIFQDGQGARYACKRVTEK